MPRVVLVGGLPGAGKSSLVQSLEYKNFVRTNWMNEDEFYRKFFK